MTNISIIYFSFSSQDKELRDVGDWRKSIEDKAGMGGRKKMFETEGWTYRADICPLVTLSDLLPLYQL